MDYIKSPFPLPPFCTPLPYLRNKKTYFIMKVAIVGSRTFNDYNKLQEFINGVCEKENIVIDTIVSGGAIGADRLGERYAKEHGIPTVVFLAEWNKYGKRAGIIRNVQIIDNCDVCIAFWDGESHGTKHDIELCEKMNKKYFIYYFEE